MNSIVQFNSSSVTDHFIVNIANGFNSKQNINYLAHSDSISFLFDTIMKLSYGRNVALPFLCSPSIGLADRVSSALFSKTNGDEQNCYESNCKDVDKKDTTSKEMEAANEIFKTIYGATPVPPEFKDLQEYLRFRKDDPRDKFLYLSSDADHNGALNPRNKAALLGFIAQAFDLKYKEFDSLKTICTEVENGAKAGKLMYVLIDAHGSPNIMDAKKAIFKTDDFTECFSGLKPHGKIVLFSCSVGRSTNKNNPFDNIAQKIATDAKRQVVAPTDLFYANLIKISTDEADQLFIYHPTYRFWPHYVFCNSNLMVAFEPNYKNCINPSMIKEREQSAADAIRDELISRSLLHSSTKSEKVQEYLGLCNDDPKEKFLFLSAEYDDAGRYADFLAPKNSANVLSMLSQRFDIQYKIVESITEICSSISVAAKTGTIAGVIIQGIREGGGFLDSAPEGMMLSKSEEITELLDANTLPTNCLTGVNPTGRIIISGSFLGKAEQRNITNHDNPTNIAQRIADRAKRTIVASKCPVYAKSVKVTSLDPLEFSHPPYGWSDGWWDSRVQSCPNTDSNLFGVFHPKI